MPLPFDATLKDLARRHPGDYVSAFRLGDAADVRSLNVDVSIISARPTWSSAMATGSDRRST
jgi:hypothetical protein